MVSRRYLAPLTIIATIGCNDGAGTATASPGGSCPDGCAIELVHAGTLSDSTRPGLFHSEYAEFSWDGRNHVYAGTPEGVAVFRLDGAATRLTEFIGRPGTGPGEFRFATPPVVGPGDSLFVYDPMLTKLAVFDPQFRLQREAAFLYRPYIPLDDGRFITSARIRTPEQAGYYFHVLDRGGTVLRSIGSDTVTYRLDRSSSAKAIALDNDGNVWVAPRGAFRFELWNLKDGSLIRHLSPEQSWFEETESSPGDGYTQRPTSWITAMWADSSLLWVVARHADAAWRSTKSGVGEMDYSADEANRIFDWRIVAIDIEEGQIIAERIVPHDVWQGPQGGAMLFSAREMTNRSIAFDAWRISLTHTSRRGE